MDSLRLGTASQVEENEENASMHSKPDAERDRSQHIGMGAQPLSSVYG